MNKINSLPTPLKVVVWLNIFLGTWTLIEAVAYSTTLPASQTISNVISAALCGLIVLGILQASRLIRMIVLVLSFLSVALLGLGLLAAIVSLGIRALVILIPLGVNCITIWGLMAVSSKTYFFGNDYSPKPRKEKKKIVRKKIEELIQVGMDEHKAREVLAPFFLKESEENISDEDYGDCRVLRYSDRMNSTDLWFVYIAEETVKAYK